MPRDIDQIIERLKAAMPGVEVSRLKAAHPGADDDVLWFIKLPGRVGEVQIESPDGACPFLIESDFGPGKQHGDTVDEVVGKVVSLYA